MGVHLRDKKLSDGRISLYLDYYPPIKKEDGSFTRREFLKRYVYAKPKDDDQRRSNKENRHFANQVLLKREREILYEQEGVFNPVNEKRDFLAFFRELAENRRESASNYNNWLSALNYLLAFSKGNCKMGDVTEEFCNRFKKYLQSADILRKGRGEKLSRNSAVSYFNKFCAAVSAAFDMKYFKEDPLKHITGIQPKETKREFLTEEELQKLVNTDCDLKALKTAALFSGLTGLRWSDVSKLKWKDIQCGDKGHFIHLVQKKTGRVMVHPINNEAVKLVGAFGNPEELIFDGLKYSANNNEKIKRWVLKAGIFKDITFHNFRHSYATILLNSGAKITTIKDLLGHEHIKTTMIYAKTHYQKKVDAANLIKLQV